MRHTTPDGISDPGLRLVGDGDGSRTAAAHRQVREELGDVAGAEHLVHGREMDLGLIVAEVGCKYADVLAFSPQELACTT